MRKSLKAQLIGSDNDLEHQQIRADTVTDEASETTESEDVNKYKKYSYLRPQIKSMADTDSVKFGTQAYSNSQRPGVQGLR